MKVPLGRAPFVYGDPKAVRVLKEKRLEGSLEAIERFGELFGAVAHPVTELNVAIRSVLEQLRSGEMIAEGYDSRRPDDKAPQPASYLAREGGGGQLEFLLGVAVAHD